MADLNRRIDTSISVGITGGDESHIADVVEENGKKFLRVKPNGGISSDLRIFHEHNLGVALDTVNYYTVFEQTGTATVSGFLVQSDKATFEVKLTIDGMVIFNINVPGLKTQIDLATIPNPGICISYSEQGRLFFFTPAFPIVAESSVLIQMRAVGSAKYVGSIVQVST